MNFLRQSGIGFAGPTIRPDANMVESYEDWSECRSISRAKRRHARGIRTRMRVKWRPRKVAVTINGGRTYLVHPSVYHALRDADLNKI